MLEVTITVKRGKAEKDTKVYQLTESGGSKKGTYMTFTPAGENADLPSFGKVYIKAERGK